MKNGEKVWGICFAGFGNVGQGLAGILADKEESLRRAGFAFRTVAVVTKTRGALADPEGISLPALLERVRLGEPVGRDTLDASEATLLPGVDIVVDVTPTNLEDGGVGLALTRTALLAGRHVVTSDKGPASLAMDELRDLARQKGCSYRFEGTVLSGTPSLNLALEAMAGCSIQSVQGIVNGTTNYILTRMEEGFGYAEALAEATKLGYAEADPRGDVDGWDAAVKAQILAGVVLGTPMPLFSVRRTGISHLTAKDVEEAARNGRRIKLIARAERTERGVSASVAPEALPLTHPLASVQGVMNALTYTTDHLGQVTITGPGAGRKETGQALLSDILAIVRGKDSGRRP